MWRTNIFPVDAIKCGIIIVKVGDNMIFITGDTHGDFRRFHTDIFPEQKQMTKDDYVIIC